VRFIHLTMKRARGVAGAVHLRDMCPGLVVIVGRNEAGKTTLARAGVSCLWHNPSLGAALFSGDVKATLIHQNSELFAVREAASGLQHMGLWPELAEPMLAGCFLLSSEAFADRGIGGSVATHIRRELAAGYDLNAVMREPRDLRPELPRYGKAVRTLRDASTNRKRVERKHLDAIADEQRLEDIERRLHELSAMQEERELLKSTREYISEHKKILFHEQQLDALPDGLETLAADDGEKATRLHSAVNASELPLTEAIDHVNDREEKLKKLGLPTDLKPELLDLLGDRELDLDRADQNRTHLKGLKDLAEKHFKGIAPGESPNAPDSEALKRLDAALQVLDEKQLARDRAKCELDAISSKEHNPSRKSEIEREFAELEQVLSSGGASWRLRKVLAATLAILAAAGAGVAAFATESPSIALPATISSGVTALVAALFAWRIDVRSPSVDERRRVAVDITELARERSDLERADVDQSLRGERTNKLEDADRELNSANDHAKGVALEFGLELIGRVQCMEAARRTVEALSARAALDQASDCVRDAEQELRRRRDARSRAVIALGLALSEDPESAERDCRTLRALQIERANLVDRKDAALRGKRAAESQLNRARQAVDDFYTSRRIADIGDRRSRLVERLQHLPEYKRIQKELGDARARRGACLTKLEHREDLRNLSEEDLVSRLESCESSLAKRDEIIDEAGGIRNQLKAILDGEELEQSHSAEAQAREALSFLRETLLDGLAADVLLQDVERAYASEPRDALVQRASALLSQFTNHRYEIVPSLSGEDDDDLGLVARCSDGTRRSLPQLSSGTRAQLHLALRIAVAESLERDGEPLPLWIDEALADTDPERFAAVGQALWQLAISGRQILFLTSDPADAERLEQLASSDTQFDARFQRIDLDVLGLEGRAAPLRALAIPQPREVPCPLSQESASDFAHRLSVPPLDPFSSADAAHLFYLLGEDPHALYQFVHARIESLGELRIALRESAVSKDLLVLAQELDSVRGPALQSFLEGWKIGRSLPVTAVVLRDGPLGRSKLLDGVIEKAVEVGGSGRALINALEAGEVKSMRAHLTHELREDLSEKGYIHDAEPLSKKELETHVLADCSALLSNGSLERGALLDRVDAWMAACNAAS